MFLIYLYFNRLDTYNPLMEVAQLIRMLLYLYSATGINEKFETRIMCILENICINLHKYTKWYVL